MILLYEFEKKFAWHSKKHWIDALQPDFKVFSSLLS